MRLRHIIPATGAVMTEDMVNYMAQGLQEDTIIETDQIKHGPPTIECEYDEALAVPDTIACSIQAEKDGAEGIFINCFGDPGVRPSRECVKIPVVGGFEPAIHLALGLADRIAIIAVVKNVVPIIEGMVAKAHLQGRIVAVRHLNIPVHELEDHTKLSPALLTESLRTIKEDRTEAIVVGCTGAVGISEQLQEDLLREGYDMPVIEAGQAAMRMLELYASMGLRHSRVTYMDPPSKPK